MARYLILVLFLASAVANASTSLRVDNRVLTVGESAAKVLQLMGEPTVRALSHGTMGGMPDNQLVPKEEWQYLQDGKTIVVTIVGGRVVNFETLY